MLAPAGTDTTTADIQEPWLPDAVFDCIDSAWRTMQGSMPRDAVVNFGRMADDLYRLPQSRDLQIRRRIGDELAAMADIAGIDPDAATQIMSDAVSPGSRRTTTFPLVSFADIKLDREQRSYRVKGLLTSTGIAVVWGPPKCGKSFWAIDLGLHIALGWEYRGSRVQQSAVVYVALEGRHGIPARLEAFKKHHGVHAAPFHLMMTPLDLIKQVDTLIGDIQQQLGDVMPGVIFIDTLNRSFVGSESKDEDMSAYLAAASKIEEAFRCLVVIVHHCGINESRPRGHTSLTGAVEVQIAVTKGAPDQVAAKVELAKDLPEGVEIFSRLENVELGTDADGDPITSLVVLPSDEIFSSRRKITGAKRVALDLLRKAIDETGSIPPASNHIPPKTRTITMSGWRAYAYQGSITESDNPDSRQKAFVRAAKDLQEAKLIGKWGDYVWLTE
jgi:hypothetical protein